MCRGGGGGGNLLYLLCLISNTMLQLEQSSLQPSTDLHHRHLQTTSYNHFLLLHLLISRKGKLKQQQARNPPLARGLRSQKGLRPFNPLQNRNKYYLFSKLVSVLRPFSMLFLFHVNLHVTFSGLSKLFITSNM